MDDAQRSSDDGDAPVGSLVAGLEGFERIGGGSFSTVYRATQVQMSRPVAVKVLDAPLSSDADRSAFERECRAMGVLSRHPNIVTVYSDARTHDGRSCLVMELYGQNYRDILSERGPLPLGELLLVGVKVAGALQAAHDTGVLHRDIKPHNIFVSDFGEPALGDFGISSIDDERIASVDAGLSVAYAAPEVIEDADASFLSDVYSLAATLHHLAEGRPPFAGGDLGAVVRRVVSEAPPALTRSDVPESLRLLLLRGLAKEPEGRPDSAGDFAESLREVRLELGLDAATVPLRTAERADRATRDGASDPTGPTDADELTITEIDEHAPADVHASKPPEGRPTRSIDDDADALPVDPGPGLPDSAGRTRASWWRTDHVAVDIAIAVAVVALVVYAIVGLT